MESLTIGQLAKNADVNVETVRYYERRGLVDQPPKPESGYRHYAPNNIAGIRFIKHAQDLGFTLREVAELLDLRVNPESSCEDVRERTQAKILDIEEKMRVLQSMKKALSELVTSCEQRSPTDECPILKALDREE